MLKESVLFRNFLQYTKVSASPTLYPCHLSGLSQLLTSSCTSILTTSLKLPAPSTHGPDHCTVPLPHFPLIAFNHKFSPYSSLLVDVLNPENRGSKLLQNVRTHTLNYINTVFQKTSSDPLMCNNQNIIVIKM